MAPFSKLKLLFVLKLKFYVGQFYREITKYSYFKKMEKSQNKDGVAEEIGCGSDIVLSKIGWGNDWDKISLVLDGWVGGWKNCFKDCLQQSTNVST